VRDETSVLKFIVVGLCIGMFAFSAWVYMETNDWVAVIFMIVSLVYGFLFSSGRLNSLFDNSASED
jgi:glucose uptake protein GlcU